MEYWVSKTEKGLFFSDPSLAYKKDRIPLNPVFHHSNVPSFHGVCSWHSQSFLNWLSEPGTQC